MYSWQLGNWVFVVTNALMLLTAGIGQWIYLGNKKGVVAPHGMQQPGGGAIVSGS